MSLLSRYVLTAYFRVFFLSLAAFVGIYLLVDFFERVDDFLEHHAHFSQYALYFINKTPLILSQVTPLAVLMGVFLTVGGFSRTQELTAMRANGVSLKRITFPLLVSALLTALVILVGNEFLVPLSVKKVNFILHTEVQGNPEVAMKRDRLWFREGNAIINVRLATPEKDLLQGVSIFELDPEFALRSRTDAAGATYADGRWTLLNGTRRIFDPASSDILAVNHFQAEPFDLSKTPDDFKVTVGKNEELGFRELRTQAAKLQAEGYDATRYRVDMHSRLAMPFANLVMAFLGIPFALQRGRGASLATGIAVSVGIGVTYHIFQAMVTAFGYSGIVSPAVAAWSVHLLFALFGLWMLLSVRE